MSNTIIYTSCYPSISIPMRTEPVGWLPPLCGSLDLRPIATLGQTSASRRMWRPTSIPIGQRITYLLSCYLFLFLFLHLTCKRPQAIERRYTYINQYYYCDFLIISRRSFNLPLVSTLSTEAWGVPVHCSYNVALVWTHLYSPHLVHSSPPLPSSTPPLSPRHLPSSTCAFPLSTPLVPSSPPLVTLFTPLITSSTPYLPISPILLPSPLRLTQLSSTSTTPSRTSPSSSSHPRPLRHSFRDEEDEDVRGWGWGWRSRIRRPWREQNTLQSQKWEQLFPSPRVHYSSERRHSGQ